MVMLDNKPVFSINRKRKNRYISIRLDKFYEKPVWADNRIFDININVNLKGQWLVDKFICRKMNRQKFEPLKGKIIHTTSIAGISVETEIPVYSIAKAGVIALTQILAKTLAPHITSNAIGYINCLFTLCIFIVIKGGI